jgi:acetoin utilization deacetylase AcuC-like enzyme
MTTAFVYDPAMFQEEMPEDIAYQPIQHGTRIRETLEALGWIGETPRTGLRLVSPRKATLEEIALVHDPAYIQTVQNTSSALQSEDTLKNRALYRQRIATSGRAALQSIQKGMLSLSTLKHTGLRGFQLLIRYMQGEKVHAIPFGEGAWVSTNTYKAKEMKIGSALTSVDLVMTEEYDNAFCFGGGHHASAAQAMGFCIFNGTAIAARYAIKHYGLQRIAIIDLDVHHGNGTQDIFYDNPDILFCDIHQAPWYPFTGASSEQGANEGIGATINIPLPAGVGFEVYEPVLQQLVLPALERFQPELLLVNMGFDTHWADPLGKIQLSSAGYAHIMHMLLQAAKTLCHGQLIVLMDGGYNHEAVACGVATCLNIMLGDDAAVDTLGPPPDRTTKLNTDPLIAELRRLHGLTGFRSQFQYKRSRGELLCEMSGEKSIPSQ